MNITNIGHSTFLIEDNGFNILTDPFFSSSFLGLKRKTLPSIPIEKLPLGGNRFFGFKMVMDPKDAALAE